MSEELQILRGVAAILNSSDTTLRASELISAGQIIASFEKLIFDLEAGDKEIAVAIKPTDGREYEDEPQLVDALESNNEEQ